MCKTLTDAEIDIIVATFPELSWMTPDDWQSVASFADWDTWIGETWATSDYALGEEHLALRDALKQREIRVSLREDCRDYFGEDNVPNVNDPDDPTWA